ncbi:MAG: NosD domain-containing protein [Candidatus Bathyarchaeia archaeon]
MLLLATILMFAFNFQRVKAWTGGTIIIHSDGSIEPIGAPIITIDNITYTLTDYVISNEDGIVIGRDNVIIDGKGFNIKGNISTGASIIGIKLEDRKNITIKNIQIMNFTKGILINRSLNIVIKENNITNNGFGIESYNLSNSNICNNYIINNRGDLDARGGLALENSSYNNIMRNNILNNSIGIKVRSSSYNNIYHNNFVNNTVQVHTDESSLMNDWDDGYPSGGNYWSDYDGVDEKSGPNQNQPGSDGIGDTLYPVNPYSNATMYDNDYYPLMGKFYYYPLIDISEIISIVSNSVVSDFRLNRTIFLISFRVTGLRYSSGFCRVMIPNILFEGMWGDEGRFSVLLDDEPIPFRTMNQPYDKENTFIYFSYTHSEHEIKILYSPPPVGGKIVPETNANPSLIKFMESLSYWYVLIVLITIMVSTVISIKKKR